jgi:urea transport system permease protein
MSIIKVWVRRCLLLTLLAVTPLAAWSATPDADAFVADSRSQQAQLLERWAAAPEPARLPLLQALAGEVLNKDEAGHAFDDSGKALGMATRPEGTLKKVRLTNRLRNLTAAALASHRLVSDNVTERKRAATALMFEATPQMAPLLNRRLTQERDGGVREALQMALAVLQLNDPNAELRLQSAQRLGSSGDPRMQARLTPLTDPIREPVAAVRTAAQHSLDNIARQLKMGELLGQIFSGLSLGSILLLAALGLAITYGLLGVINMAHGEMLMLGAYAGWMVQNAFSQWAPQWLGWWPLAALPVAFMMTAAIGMLLERSVIRHLYGRPLETLLATWGISLMLIQGVRMLVGPQNVEVANPAWLSGGIQALPNLILPWNRLAVLLFVLLVLGFTWLILNRTRLGLHIRAVTQNRAMAACCGVPTGRVDMLAFGLGSGIAGLGGVALTQLGNVGPELGQGYIIDSFLVVVLGGVGQLAGSVVAAFSLGIFNKLLEPQVGAVLGKILILVLVVLFIQKRPQGLFALKGRITE